MKKIVAVIIVVVVSSFFFSSASFAEEDLTCYFQKGEKFLMLEVSSNEPKVSSWVLSQLRTQLEAEEWSPVESYVLEVEGYPNLYLGVEIPNGDALIQNNDSGKGKLFSHLLYEKGWRGFILNQLHFLE